MDEVETLFNEIESAHKHAARWSHWELVIKRARVAYRDVKRIFVEQSKALEIACALMTPEQLEEYRHRAYPKLYPRT
jgi:ABC-type branched-subunit amino acid transport system ATPase component